MSIEANNIIFLDVDGVLNWDGSKSYVSISEHITYLGIDNIRVKRLAKIVDATNAKIVLTSTWAEHFEVGAYKQQDRICKYLSNKLRKQSLKIYDIIDQNIPWLDRGIAIDTWLKNHPHKNWVVLDDQNFFRGYDEPVIKDHFINTVDNVDDDESSGLTDYLTQKAIDILNGKISGTFFDDKYLREYR